MAVIAKTDWDFKRRLETLHFTNPKFELIVLGHSLAANGIDTEYLTLNDIESYNLSVGGSFPKTNLIQLNEYLLKCHENPKYVILGLASYLGSFDRETIHPIIEFTMDDYKFGVHDIPVIKFQWLGVQFLKKIVSKIHRDVRLSLGQLKSQKVTPDISQYSDMELNISAYTESYYVGQIAEICSLNGIELIIIEMPGFKRTQNSSDIGPYLLNFKNGQSANLYNFNSKAFCEIFNANEDWTSNSHLNEFGAKKFTKELVKYIKK